MALSYPPANAPTIAGTLAGMNGSVTVHMDAPPEEIWALVADVTKIGRYSPETFEAEWLDGATGPAVGAKFRGHVKRNQKGPVYWAPCTVVACEPGREFAFTAGPAIKSVNTWRYRMEPSPEGGTDVTESFELAPTLPLRIYWALAGWARGRTNHEGMRTTLERIKAEVEGTPAP
jgi:uncharacterized protein YndB with AHSA1/START domain